MKRWMSEIPGTLVVACGLATWVLAAPEASSPDRNTPAAASEMKLTVALPQRTDAGVWDGTWFYVNRDARWAIWLRTRDGRPEMKLQYQNLSNPEAFETDWDGRATYYLAGEQAVFEVALDQRDRNELHGTLRWDVQFADSGRTETATLRFYRAADGRQLVMVLHPYERLLRRHDKVTRYAMSTAWTFAKASKRVVLWEELPF